MTKTYKKIEDHVFNKIYISLLWIPEVDLLRCRINIGEGNGTPLQYSCLENPWMEEPGGLQSMGSRRVGHDSDFTFTFHFHALEKEMATHSSILAQRIPGTGAWWAAIYGVAQSRTRLSNLAAAAYCIDVFLSDFTLYNRLQFHPSH